MTVNLGCDGLTTLWGPMTSDLDSARDIVPVKALLGCVSVLGILLLLLGLHFLFLLGLALFFEFLLFFVDQLSDLSRETCELLVVTTCIEHFEISLEQFDFGEVALHLLALLVEAVELIVEAFVGLGEVTVLDLALDQIDLADNVLIEVLNVHLHTDDLGHAELPPDHTLVLVALYLLDLSVDLREHFLEGLRVVDYGRVAVDLVAAVQVYGLSGLGLLGSHEKQYCSRDQLNRRLHFYYNNNL